MSLAAAAVPLVASFLGRVGKRVAGQVSEDLEEAAAEKLKGLYKAIKDRLSGDGYAAGALKRREEQPDNENRQVAVAEVLAEAAQDDAGFAETLAQLVDETKGVSGNLEVDDIEGHAAAIKARVVSGNVTATGKAKKVHEGAEFYGIEADEIRGG